MTRPAFFERLVLARLNSLAEGRLTLVDRDRRITVGTPGELEATITVRDARFYRAVALGGHLGAADAWVDGWWTTDDLTAVIRVLARNRHVVEGLERGLAKLLTPLHKLALLADRNTRRGSRKNIMAHYDLGNDFFASFLDETMTYSSGIFDHPGASMRQASLAKYERLCQQLELRSTDRVIEIGSGWGGFAIHAASTRGCHVTTTTISPEQHALATERVRSAGLADRVTVLLADYRDLTGTFDKLVSIEMVEAVGHEYYGTYFARCAALLAPHGLAAIQAITIQDRFYDSARREMDFIKRYIFPGSCIPSVSILAGAAATTDFRLVDLHDITPHYAETLRLWREQFEMNWPRIRAQGCDEEFRRLWQFYFCYCEGGFREGVIGDVQLLFAKPRAGLAAPEPESVMMEVAA